MFWKGSLHLRWKNQAGWSIPVIPALRRLREEDGELTTEGGP